MSGSCRKTMERSRARSGNEAGNGGYRNRLERGAALSPLTLRSYALCSVIITRLTCVETDARNALQSTCPVCNNLFQNKSELCDRRPLIACANDHTICADCCNECRKSPDGKCPTCGDGLLQKPNLNKFLNELIANCVHVLKISVKNIKMEKKHFAYGAFGKVYNATWGQKTVVVKVIKANCEEEKQAVMCEANITLRLHHPNVIKLFGITDDLMDEIGIVMEKAEHGSLDLLIGTITREEETKIALGIIDGLEYIHSQHVIHRDIKPRNILMFAIIPKIADFGVSKVIDTAMMTHTGGVGQFIYMAPEVYLYREYGFSADIFSLSMTLFEIFSEKPISDSSKDVMKFILGIVHGGTVGEIPKECKVPVNLLNVIERGWNSDPEGRPTFSEYRSSLHGKIYLVCSHVK